MINPSLKFDALLLFIVIVKFSLFAPTAIAEEFSTTNMQLLYGSNFDDRYYGNNTTDGNMTTLTLEHFGVWSYGDNFFFVDLTSGDFVDFNGTVTGSSSHTYVEWAPRISLSKLAGNSLSAGIFRDYYLAAQLNQDGLGFHAELIGVGADLAIPNFNVASINVYKRKDNFNQATWQVSGVWSVPLATYMSLDGFFDLNGTDNNGTEVSAQPQLLYDISHLAGEPSGNVMLGVEWYFHKNNQMISSVPQAMVKWVW